MITNDLIVRHPEPGHSRIKYIPHFGEGSLNVGPSLNEIADDNDEIGIQKVDFVNRPIELWRLSVWILRIATWVVVPQDYKGKGVLAFRCGDFQTENRSTAAQEKERCYK